MASKGLGYSMGSRKEETQEKLAAVFVGVCHNLNAVYFHFSSPSLEFAPT